MATEHFKTHFNFKWLCLMNQFKRKYITMWYQSKCYSECHTLNICKINDKYKSNARSLAFLRYFGESKKIDRTRHLLSIIFLLSNSLTNSSENVHKSDRILTITIQYTTYDFITLKYIHVCMYGIVIVSRRVEWLLNVRCCFKIGNLQWKCCVNSHFVSHAN